MTRNDSWRTVVLNVGLVRGLLQRGDDLRAGVDRVLRDDLGAALDGLVQREPEPLFLVFDQRLLTLPLSIWAIATDVGTCL